MNKKKLEKLTYKLQESIFIGFFIRLAEYLYNLIGKSLSAKLMTCYESYGKYADGSAAISFWKKILPSERKKLKFKMAFSKAIDESLFSKFFKSAVDTFLGVKIRLYGVGIFTFGAITVILNIIKEKMDIPDMGHINMIVGFGSMIFSIPMLINKSSFGKLLADGVIIGFITKNVIGASREELIVDKKTDKITLPIIFGVLFGISTFALSSVYILSAVALVVLLLLIFSKPEFGICLLVLAIPFIPTMAMCAFVILIFAAYLLKVLRGKRSLRFDTLDISVLIFLFFMALGGIFSVDRASSIKPAAVFVCLGMVYFLIVNLIKNTKLVKRVVACMMFSATLTALYGIYQNFFTQNSKWHDSEMFSEIETRVVSTFENPNVFGEYLIMMIPFAFALLLSHEFKNNRFSFFITTASAIAALVFTWSRGAWIGFIAAIFIFMLIYSKKTMIFYCFGLFALPFLPFVLPESIITRFTSIGDMRDTSTSYRVYIWEAAVKMIKDFFVSGIGIGEGAFAKVYPEYTLAGIESAPHSHNLFLQILIELGIFGFLVFAAMIIILMQKTFTYIVKGNNRTMQLLCAAALCGVIAMLVQGVTDYVWYNYRVYGQFFVIIGLCSAAVNSAKNEECTQNYFGE